MESHMTLQWRHNRCDGVLNHQPDDLQFYDLFRRRWKKTSKLRATGLCAGKSPVTGEFPTQMASNAENVSTWLRHHVMFDISHENQNRISLSSYTCISTLQLAAVVKQNQINLDIGTLIGNISKAKLSFIMTLSSGSLLFYRPIYYLNKCLLSNMMSSEHV